MGLTQSDSVCLTNLFDLTSGTYSVNALSLLCRLCYH